MHYLTIYPALTEAIEGLIAEYGVDAVEGVVDELLQEMSEGDEDGEFSG